jgi:hypothetical protein
MGCAVSFSAQVRFPGKPHGLPGPAGRVWRTWGAVQGDGSLQGVLRTRLDQGEKLGARVLLVEDSYHGRGHG